MRCFFLLLADSEKTARLREEMRRARERQQQKAKDIVKASVEAEKKRKHEERERHRRALEVCARDVLRALQTPSVRGPS